MSEFEQTKEMIERLESKLGLIMKFIEKQYNAEFIDMCKNIYHRNYSYLGRKCPDCESYHPQPYVKLKQSQPDLL